MKFVPNRLLLWVTVLLVIPSTTLVVLGGTAATLALLFCVLLLAGAVMDLGSSYRLLEQLRVDSDELLRCTKGKEFAVVLKFECKGVALRNLSFGLQMPEVFNALDHPIMSISELPADRVVAVDYTLLPLRRGRYLFENVYVETPSRLGLWLIRERKSLSLEVRTYPDLSRERRRLAGLFLNRGSDGAHVRRQVGKGREFEQLREYLPGDDYADIDWKAMARRGEPVTRTFQIERTQEVYVVVDHSRMSAREIRTPLDEARQAGAAMQAENIEHGAGGDFMVNTQLERFLHCSLILSSVAQRQGDLFGFVSFADGVDRFVRSRNGSSHYNVVRDALYTLEPKKVAPDFEQLMISLRQRLTRRALLVMLVDLSDPLTAESFYESIALISRQHLVLVNMVRPEHAHPLFSPKRIPAESDEVYECLSGHFQWQELREIKKRLAHLGVELAMPDHESLSTEAVTQYLNVKRRQLI